MEEIIHIVPLGWEKDRAVLPIIKMKAHKAYLIYRNDDRVYIPHFVDKVKEKLNKEKIKVEDVIIEDARNLFEQVLLNVSKIIIKEGKKESRIHINISASGKIDAAAATLAGMYHSKKIGSIYYVNPTSYSVITEEEDPKSIFKEHGLSVGMADIYNLPFFSIQRPNPSSLFILRYIYENNPQTYELLLHALSKAQIKPFKDFNIDTKKKGLTTEERRDLQGWKMRLKRILEEISKENYIEIKPSYKKREKLVELTDEGKYAAILTGEITQIK